MKNTNLTLILLAATTLSGQAFAADVSPKIEKMKAIISCVQHQIKTLAQTERAMSDVSFENSKKAYAAERRIKGRYRVYTEAVELYSKWINESEGNLSDAQTAYGKKTIYENLSENAKTMAGRYRNLSHSYSWVTLNFDIYSQEVAANEHGLENEFLSSMAFDLRKADFQRETLDRLARQFGVEAEQVQPCVPMIYDLN